MKKSLGIISIVFVFSLASIGGAQQFGAEEHTAKAGKFSFGVGYLLGQRKGEPSDESGAFFIFRNGESISNQVYPNRSFGFTENWEAYARVGVADAKLPDSIVAEYLSNSFHDSSKLFGTLGIKGLLFSKDYLSIGPFFQGSLYSSYKDTALSGLLLTPPGTVPASLTGKNNIPWDVDFGVTIQVKSPQGMSFYFGPVVYWQRGESDFEGTGGTVGAINSTPFKEKSNFGGFMGARLPLLYPDLSIEVKGQYRNDFSMGGLISYSF